VLRQPLKHLGVANLMENRDEILINQVTMQNNKGKHTSHRLYAQKGK
jgi:hypothetical protein